MSTPEKKVENNHTRLAACATLADTDRKRGAQDEPRALWLGILHGLTLVVVAIRKYLKVERCEHCGR